MVAKTYAKADNKPGMEVTKPILNHIQPETSAWLTRKVIGEKSLPKISHDVLQ